MPTLVIPALRTRTAPAPGRTTAAPRERTIPERLRRASRALADDTGAATAEYAIATLAAVGLAGLLVVVLRGDDVKGLLTDLIRRALTSSV